MTLAENIQKVINNIDNFYKRRIVIFVGCNAGSASNNSTLYYVDLADKPDRYGDITAYYYNKNFSTQYTTAVGYNSAINNFKRDIWGVLEKGINDAY